MDMDFLYMLILKEKSRVRETLNLLTIADRSNETIFVLSFFEVPWKCHGNEVKWKCRGSTIEVLLKCKQPTDNSPC